MVRAPALAALVLALAVVGCSKATPPAGPPAITWDQYQTVQQGMTYDQVVALVHDKGEQKATPDAQTQGYTFGPPAASIVVVFVDGKVVDKSTVDLKAPPLK